jgi:predicted  nucleic acid-binding Zn-ribbon protein
MTTDLKRDLHVLISVAKLDAAVTECRTDLARLPDKLETLRQAIADIEEKEKTSKNELEEMTKERRTIEQDLEDNASKIKQLKTQQMSVKTNKEYTAMIHEIEHLEKDTDQKEERLLFLMDELDQQSDNHKQSLERSAKEKRDLKSRATEIENRITELESEVEKLQSEKPKFLREINPQIKKRYDRLLAKHGDTAVTHIVDDTCQGCFTRIPPQVAVEVKKNEQLIACEACGRMLVHYDA